MLFLLLVVAILLIIFFHIFSQLEKQSIIAEFAGRIGLKQTYLFLFIYFALFLSFCFGSYLSKGNLDNINYSYSEQRAQRSQYLAELQNEAVEQFSLSRYDKAERNYYKILLGGAQNANIIVGYVLAQLAQNIHNKAQISWLQKAISLSPKDEYAQTLLKRLNKPYAK